MQWVLIALGVVLAIVAVFALQNPAVVTVRFLNFEADASVLVVILVAFAAGVFSGILALLPSSVRKSGRMRKMSSELRSLERYRLRETAPSGPAERTGTPAGADARRWREAEADAAPAPDPGAAAGPENPPAGPQEISDPAHGEPEKGGLGRFFR